MLDRSPSNARPLALGTLSFAVCFAAWGLISAFAPRFRELFSLSATQTVDPLLRAPDGFRKATWDEALDFTARWLREIQERYGKDAVALYGRGPISRCSWGCCM